MANAFLVSLFEFKRWMNAELYRALCALPQERRNQILPAVSYVRDATDDALNTPVAFTFVSDGEPGLMTRAQMLAHVLTHAQSHRGSVGAMLAGLDIALPSDMFTSYVRAAG